MTMADVKKTREESSILECMGNSFQLGNCRNKIKRNSKN